MSKYVIDLRKNYTVTGAITIDIPSSAAQTEEEVIDSINKQIASGEIQTTDPRIIWNDLEYVDYSFAVDTGESFDEDDYE